MPERTRIFISYSHRDGGTLASRLAADLSTRGYAVWLDQQRLKGGSSWSQEIEQALDASEVVLTLLSSGAYQSEVCRGEQLRSLRHQKCVIPMLVQANSDAPVYLEAREYRDFSDPAFYASRLEDLLADIEARSGSNLAVAYQETRYETVPPLPTNFVARPAELESLRQTLLTDCRDRKIELVALRGMPGVGKTVLAQALCYDEAVQAVFPDGIVWVKLGKSPSESDLIREMREAAKALGAIAHGFETLSESSKRLRGILRDKRALLVMDDAWQAEHVYLFQPQHAKFFRLLFTTRSAEAIAAIGAREQVLGTLPEYQARRLLANFSSRREEELPAAAVGILRECRGLALALAMIGAVLRTKSDDRWADLLESLTRSNLEEVRLKLPNYKYASFGAAMEASILDLPVKTQRQYRDLAVFPDNTAILEGALEVMWGVESKQVRRITAQLADRSLAALDTQTRLSLHDLQIDYLRERAGDLILLHNRLIERYRMRNPNGWHAASDDGYLVQNLVHHLRLAGMKSEIRKLLSQQNPDGRPAWYKTKLAAGDETGYRTDIAMAWDYEGETVVGDPAFPQSVGLQVRYATILASFNSMASIALASPLWEAAIIRWPKRAARWLPYVHRIPEDYLRAEALIKVAPHLKAELLIEVLQLALELPDEHVRGSTLARLANYLSGALLEQACKGIFEIGSGYARSKALEMATGRIPDELLERALRSAERLEDESQRATAMIAISARLVQSGRVTEAFTRCGIGGEARFEHQARAIEIFAPHLPANAVRRVFQLSLASVPSKARTRALSSLVRCIPDDLVRLALSAISGIDDEYVGDFAREVGSRLSASELREAIAKYQTHKWQSAVLVQWLPRFAEIGYADEALSMLPAIEMAWGRALTLSLMTRYLPDQLIARALEIADNLSDDKDRPGSRPFALRALAGRLAGEERSQLLDIVLNEVGSLEPELWK